MDKRSQNFSCFHGLICKAVRSFSLMAATNNASFVECTHNHILLCGLRVSAHAGEVAKGEQVNTESHQQNVPGNVGSLLHHVSICLWPLLKCHLLPRIIFPVSDCVYLRLTWCLRTILQKIKRKQGLFRWNNNNSGVMKSTELHCLYSKRNSRIDCRSLAPNSWEPPPSVTVCCHLVVKNTNFNSAPTAAKVLNPT